MVHKIFRLCFASLLVLLLSACQPSTTLERIEIPSTDADINTESLVDEDGWMDRSGFLSGLVSSRRSLPETVDGATEYKVIIGIDEAISFLEGQVEVVYTNREEIELNEIYFRSFPNFFLETPLTISKLEADGETQAPQFMLANTVFSVPLPTPLSPGEKTHIRFDFSFNIPAASEAPFSLFGYEDGILALDGFFPTVVVYDAGGWSLGNPPQWEENAYADASFILVTINMPEGWVIAASGVETSRSVSAGRQHVSFAVGPARGFSLAAGKDLVMTTAQVGETTINSYAPPELAAGSADALEFAVNAIKSFNHRLGEYPYTELDLVSTPLQASGSASSGFAVFNRTYYEEGNVLDEVPALNNLERTVAHELAHQWFFNLVGNDYANEVWIPEAFAQYMTSLYYLDIYGAEEQALYEQDWIGRWSEAGSREIPIGLGVADFAAGETRAIIYGRGPLFISQLSDQIGEDRFDLVLPTYMVENEWGLATGDQFREIAEKRCACDLGRLFTEWVYPIGYTQDSSPATEGQTIVIQPGLPFNTAQSATDFQLLYPGYFPDGFEFYGASLSGGGEATLNFLQKEPTMRLAVLVHTMLGAKSNFSISMSSENAQFVMVNGVEATWFFDPTGNEGLLDWTANGVRYRLVGILDLEEALKIAESLE